MLPLKTMPPAGKFGAAGNPFSQQRLEQLEFRFPDGAGWECNFAKLSRLGCRASIVGPRGTGKSTLLRQMQRHLNRQLKKRLNPVSDPLPTVLEKSVLLDIPRNGTDTRAGEVTRADQRDLVASICDHLNEETILLIDGIERLTYIDRWRLIHRTCAADRVGGVIVNQHRATLLLPIWIRTTPSQELLDSLLLELLEGLEVDHKHVVSEARRLLTQHKGNIREVFRSLYDAWTG